MNEMYQQNLIMNYLKDHKSISPAQAFDLFGITKLSTRIGELIGKGVPIVKLRVKGFNRFGKRTSFMTYSLGDDNGDKG